MSTYASPLIGGSLAKPSDRFPTLFGGEFWKQYPYFLPCLAAATITFIPFLATLFFFKEVGIAQPICLLPSDILQSLASLSHPAEASERIPFASTIDKPLPLRQLISYPLFISVANFACLEFLHTSQSALIPLFLAMPIKIGGLGFDPRRIGYILGTYQAVTAVFMATYFPKIVRYLGERRTYVHAISTFPLLWVILPVMNLYARHSGISTGVWSGIVLWIVPKTSTDMAFGSFLFLIQVLGD